MLFIALSLIAALAATLSGITGIGGGTILIAALFAAGLTPQIAIGVHAVVQLCSNSSRTMAYFHHVNFKALGWFALGAAPAPFLAAPLLNSADPDVLRLLLGSFVLLALFPHGIERLRLHNNFGLVLAGVIAGGVGMFVGATGLLIMPFFLRSDWSKQTVVGTLAVTQAAAHGFKIIALVTIGFDAIASWGFWLPMSMAVIVGTACGRYLHERVPEQGFRALVRMIMAALALKLIFDGLVAI